MFTDQIWFSVAVAVYAVAFMYSLALLKQGVQSGNGASRLVLLGFTSHTAFLVQRGASLRHCPITNAFELLVFATWAIVGIYLLVHLVTRAGFLSVFVLPIVIAIGIAALFLPSDVTSADKTATGVYFGLHVAVMMLSYGAFALAGAAGAMYLLQEQQLKSRHLSGFFHLLPSIEKLDRMNTWLLVTGFFLLTIGIGAGCLWNSTLNHLLHPHDPRIMAASAVWFIYALLLVARVLFSLRGRKIAFVSLVSSIIVLITLGLTHNLPHGS